jgi:hypothetical protein
MGVMLEMPVKRSDLGLRERLRPALLRRSSLTRVARCCEGGMSKIDR